MDIQTKKKEIDLLDFWRVALRRKWIIITSVFVILTLGGVYSFTKTPLYRATATVLLEDQGTSLLKLEDIFNYSTGTLGVEFETQIKLLRSRSLAERVAVKMNLRERPELQRLQKPKRDPVRMVRSFFTLKWLRQGLEEDDESGSNFIVRNDPNLDLAPIVIYGLSVSNIEDTRLVEISHTFPDSVLATDIVNTIVDEFINYNVEMKYQATQQASDFLSEQIAHFREELATKEKELQKYGEEKNLLFLSKEESTIVNEFNNLYSAYMSAQIDRINKEASYRELKGIKVDSIPQYLNNPLIQSLKSEYTRLITDYYEKGKALKSDYPEMVNLRARLDSTRKQLEEEITKGVESASVEYKTAQQKEDSLRREVESQRVNVLKMNSNSILYNSLKSEVENLRSLLNEMDARQNETLVSARLKGLKTSNIKVIDRALIPGSPVSPNKKRLMILSLILGLFCGAGLAFLIDYTDNTVKGPEEVEKLVGLPSLGIIPRISPDKSKKRFSYYSRYRNYGNGGRDSEKQLEEVKDIELINHLFPKLSISEDYRTIRTSILFSHAESLPRTIMFTSAFPQEGKTSAITNTAISFSQLEKKVLLIDADLRKPRLHQIFSARNRIGLSSYLIGIASEENIIKETSVENLWLIPSGTHPPNPAELINSKRMENLITNIIAKFDFIFIDTPPVLAVIEPVVISSICNAVVFVVKEATTARKPLVKAVEEIRKANGNIIGVIFNEVRVNKKGYYKSPYYYNYMYTYEQDKDSADEVCSS